MIYNVNGQAINSAYDVNGTPLSQAYDIDGNELLESELISIDDSTGTASGYTLTSAESGKSYVMRTMVDFWATRSYQMQSFGYDYDNGHYYCFNSSTTVLKYASDLSYVEAITLPSNAGHNNDTWYYDGKFYFPNHTTTELYVWNISANTVSTIPVSGIVQPQNGSSRRIDSICDTEARDGTAYLVCRDVYTTELVHQPDDKMSIYLYDIATGVATLLAELPWDCVYNQGCTCLNGILYVACNTQTTGSASNYKGITMKAVRTDTWQLVDELVYSGVVEPEGMDVVPADGTQQLQMGIAHWQSVSIATRFTAPYALRREAS